MPCRSMRASMLIVSLTCGAVPESAWAGGCGPPDCGTVCDPPEQVTLYCQLSGMPPAGAPCYVTYGNPQACGSAVLNLTWDGDRYLMDYSIDLNSSYTVTHAHLYQVDQCDCNPQQQVYNSNICWGPPYGCDLLQGSGFHDTRFCDLVCDVLDDPTSWMLIVHTEGGHFGVDGEGKLIPYEPGNAEHDALYNQPCGISETKDCLGTRFNSRVPRKLDDRRLRLCETRESGPTYGCMVDLPVLPATACDGLVVCHDGENPVPFPDALGRNWMEPDGKGGFQLTQEAISEGYSLDECYLFHLYDDQGILNNYNNGGPEGAVGGYVTVCPGDPDLDGDGTVGIVDFLALLKRWGPNPGNPADLDCDGTVGVVDFLTLLAHWGTCP